MKLRQFHIGAFADRVFEGNPASVVPLDAWLEDSLLQAIAGENNLSETAFFVSSDKGFHLRWFTPVCEVDLCGHATLAAAHVLFRHLDYPEDSITFSTRSGKLVVRKAGELLSMDFPLSQPKICLTPEPLISALGRTPIEVFSSESYIAVFENASIIRSIAPDERLLSLLDLRGVSVTASGEELRDGTDFVSRYFAPKVGVSEDPVTGSVHCSLAPYWANRLKKNNLMARQLSARGGKMSCEIKGGRVILLGNAVTFMTGEFDVPLSPDPGGGNLS